jgi:hypothetical protein
MSPRRASDENIAINMRAPLGIPWCVESDAADGTLGSFSDELGMDEDVTVGSVGELIVGLLRGKDWVVAKMLWVAGWTPTFTTAVYEVEMNDPLVATLSSLVVMTGLGESELSITTGVG